MKDHQRSRLTHANQLVINWHLSEACNYSCRYCYAKWEAPVQTRPVIHDPLRIRELLLELKRFFSPDNSSNPLRQQMSWDAIRLNIAGGEPLLYARKVINVATLARQIGFDVSLISNGSRLTAPIMRDLAPMLSLLGLSIDSSDANLNRLIGRTDVRGKTLEFAELHDVVAEGRRLNAELRLKVNTVVNSVNHLGDMTPIIQRLAPERWKVLRMLPIVNNDLAISELEFNDFVQRHEHLRSIIQVEDDYDMTESYLMVDPLGRFFQNSAGDIGQGQGYRYSSPILETGAESAFSEIRFSACKFRGRYEKSETEGSV